MRYLRGHARIAVALAGVVIAGSAIGAVAAPGGGGTHTRGTVYLASTPKPGSLVYAAGVATDSVLGPTAVTYTIKATSQRTGTVLANAKKVVVWTKNGTLSGTGSATLTVTNHPKAGDVTVSKGKFSLKQGTGGQQGHSFVGAFTGQGNILNGVYVFNYKAIYK